MTFQKCHLASVSDSPAIPDLHISRPRSTDSSEARSTQTNEANSSLCTDVTAESCTLEVS